MVDDHKDIALIYPVHMNPNVKGPVHKLLGNQERIYLIEPINYLECLHLMEKCHFIITDSGGIQEEAPDFKKPVLITRQTTERPEILGAGGILVGTESETICSCADNLLKNPDIYAQMVCNKNPFGDGKAAERIVSILEKKLSDQND